MAAEDIEFQPAGTVVTASGASSWVPVPTLTMLMVGIAVTANVGTPSLTAWLQGSNDGGTTGFDLLSDQSMKSAETVAAEPTTEEAQNKRNINNNAISAAGKWSALYKHLAASHVRLVWIFSGSTSITWGVKARGK